MAKVNLNSPLTMEEAFERFLFGCSPEKCQNHYYKYYFSTVREDAA